MSGSQSASEREACRTRAPRARCAAWHAASRCLRSRSRLRCPAAFSARNGPTSISKCPRTIAPRRKANADAAVPVLDWWRGFRSGELTSLMDAAQIYNLDIAVAIAQIVQADAQVGVSGAPLLPSHDRQSAAPSATTPVRKPAAAGRRTTFSQHLLRH